MDTLDDIMSDRGAVAPAEPTAPERISDADRAANPLGAARRERDVQGRFARPGKEATPKPEGRQQDDLGAQATADDPQRRQPGTVPQQALEAERRKRQERDDQIAELIRKNTELMARVSQPAAPAKPAETPAEPVFWENPEAALEHRLKSAVDPLSQRLTQESNAIRLHLSQRFAVQEHGADAVKEAAMAAAALRQSNPAEFQRMEAQADKSMDPVGDLVRWHKQQRAITEVGEDPEAYFQRRLAAWQAENGFDDAPLQQQPPATSGRAPPASNPTRLPSSFAGARSGGWRGGAGHGGTRSLSEIMGR